MYIVSGTQMLGYSEYKCVLFPQYTLSTEHIWNQDNILKYKHGNNSNLWKKNGKYVVI